VKLTAAVEANSTAKAGLKADIQRLQEEVAELRYGTLHACTAAAFSTAVLRIPSRVDHSLGCVCMLLSLIVELLLLLFVQAGQGCVNQGSSSGQVGRSAGAGQRSQVQHCCTGKPYSVPAQSTDYTTS
jgi:hypothetical protein